MLKKTISALLITSLAVCCAGCWDSRDINKASILTTILVDKQGDNVLFYVEVANTEVSGGTDGGNAVADKFTIVRGSGKSFVDARDDLDNKLKYPVYLSAARALVLTQNIAREDIAEYLNRLRADVEYRKKVITVTTNADPEELLNILQRKESVGFYIEKALDKMTSYQQMVRRSTALFIESLSNKYSGFLIPDVGIGDGMLNIKGFSVVLGSKVVGFIPSTEWDGVIFLNAGSPEIEYVIPFDGKKLTFLISLKKRAIEPIYKGGVVTFNINLDFKAEFQYPDIRCPCILTKEHFDKLSGVIASILKKDVTDALNISQNTFHCDYFDFNRVFHMSYPNEYHKISWNEAYAKAKFNVKVKVKADNAGMLDYGEHKQE